MKVLILVKTYPQISRKHVETVCTAGLTEDGKWVRLYPIPFRKLEYEQQYKKFEWMNVPLVRNTDDFRPETYRPHMSEMKRGDFVKNWDERRQIIFSNTPVFSNLTTLIAQAKSDKVSLAIFKPTGIVDFKVENTERDWPQDRLECIRAMSKQGTFFQTPEELAREFEVVKKVPYKFSYTFKDDEGRPSTMMIADWEIGMLYWNCFEQYKDEQVATEKVKQKYFGEFLKKDVYLFLGTTKEHHNTAPNPFIIVGVMAPPRQHQKLLF